MFRRLLTATVLVGGLVWWLFRLKPLKDAPTPRLAPDYAGAMARVAGMQAHDSTRINPICRTQFLTHGAPAPKAFGLVHGFTNCPAQYEALARELFARGYNVVIPRISHHGLSDTLARDVADLSAEEMVGVAAAVCDALSGLGEETILVGFSMGGAVAAWAAQNRADVDHVVLVAPALAVAAVPWRLQRPVARLLGVLPNRFVWWDPDLREARVGPAHSYPRFATRAVGQLLRLGALVEATARRQIYVCGRVTVITNPQDGTVNNEGIARVVRNWRRQGAAVTTYEFPADLGLIHDFVDPSRPDQQTDLAYPSLLAWIDGGQQAG